MAVLPRNVTRMRDLVLKAGLVDDLQIRSAMAHFQQWGGRFAHALVELGFVDEEVLTEAIGRSLKLAVTHLGRVPKDAAALAKVEVEFCDENAVFPVLLRERTLTLAMADPTAIDVIDAVQGKSGVRVVPVLAAESEIVSAIARHYRGKTVTTEMNRARTAVTKEFKMPHGPGVELELDTDSLPPPNQQRGAPARAPAPAPPPPPPPARTESGFMAARPSSANSLLDEMLGESEKADLSFTPEEMERLRAAKATQEKAGQILRALQELLTAKGLLR